MTGTFKPRIFDRVDYIAPKVFHKTNDFRDTFVICIIENEG